MMDIKYLCVSWQALLNVLKDFIGHGYYYYHVIELPIHKDKDWTKTDQKLINKYKAYYDDRGTYRYYERKKKGLANFRYLRWEGLIIILHTDGKVITTEQLKKKMDPNDKRKYLKSETDKSLLHQFKKESNVKMYSVEYEEKFDDIRQKPIFLKISDEVSFSVQLSPLPNPHKKFKEVTAQLNGLKKKKKKNDEVMKSIEILTFQQEKFKKQINEYNKKQHSLTIKFSKIFFKNKRAELAELVEHRHVDKLIYSFDMLNGFPSNHRGIIKDKKDLKKWIFHCATKNGLQLSEKDFLIKETQKPFGDLFVKRTFIQKFHQG